MAVKKYFRKYFLVGLKIALCNFSTILIFYLSIIIYNMFNEYNDMSNYMTYDSSSLNQYNYSNFNTALPIYQQYENLYHFTRQINSISLSNVSAQSRDPTNLPCDIRPMIYAQGEADNNELLNLHRTRENNPNNWRDLITSKPGYYDQNEHTNNYYRPKSLIQAGQATSNLDIHGYLLF